jgi:hypothetical protein
MGERPIWQGQWIIVHPNDEWEFHSCVRCGQPLEGARARKRGMGDACWQRLKPAERKLEKEEALRKDRQWWREFHRRPVYS